jgi:hypothetical protein
MHLQRFLPLLLSAALLSGCTESKLKKQATATALQLFQAIRSSDEAKAAATYPGFSNFKTYYKSDSATVIGVDHRDSVFVVAVHNHFTNGLGKKSENTIYLIIKPLDDKSMTILNSSGLSDFTEEDNYKVALGTGCLSKSDTMDQSILLGMEKASSIKVSEAAALLDKLQTGCVVSDWSWESGYAGSASGKGIVSNLSGYSIPRLKYKITYKDNGGNEITSDDGYVSVDPIESGSSRSFTFYTSYVGGASKASIKLDFDLDLVLKFVGQREDWTGRECTEYYEKNPDELAAIQEKMQ